MIICQHQFLIGQAPVLTPKNQGNAWRMTLRGLFAVVINQQICGLLGADDRLWQVARAATGRQNPRAICHRRGQVINHTRMV